MRCLTQKLEKAGVIQQAHQMDDAALALDGLLDACQSPKLPLHTFTCASPEDCASFGYPTGQMARAQDQNDFVIRATPRAHANLQALLQERVMAPVADCKAETPGGQEHLLPSAIRAKQRRGRSWGNKKMLKYIMIYQGSIEISINIGFTHHLN